MKTFIAKFIFALMLVTQFAIAAEEQATIRVNDPWVREAPPSATLTAAYMVIENTSSQEQTLVAATSPAFAKVEIHQTVKKEDGMMQMVPMPKLAIPASGKVVLKPGDYHIMLIDRKQDLKEGDKVDLTLEFASGDKVVLSAPVRKMPAMEMNHPMHQPENK